MNPFHCPKLRWNVRGDGDLIKAALAAHMDFKGSGAVKSPGLSSSAVSYAAVTKPDTPCLRFSGMSST